MEKTRHSGRYYVLLALVLVLSWLMLSGQSCPGGNRSQPAPTRYTRPAPAPRSIGVRPGPTGPTANLPMALSRTRTAVNRADWAAADREASGVGSAWVPLRTVWPPAAAARFEGAYSRLQRAVAARDKAAARKALDELDRLAKENAGARPVKTRAIPGRVVPSRPTRTGAPLAPR
ncbi:MAG: hypothetical protein ACM3RP_04830 [Chitinophagales bacterium]